jgi:Uma2 family endonuclease
MITDINQLDLNKRYTYAEYLTWQFKERVELLKGYIFRMSPAPNLKHQRISGDIHGELYIFLKGKSCRTFSAPFDVRLPVSLKKGKTDTVVQPDITVVCNPNILDKQGCNGRPDLVMEILSPGNSKNEMREKFDIYQEAKISEYWLIHPVDESVIVYTLNEEDKYIGSRLYMEDDLVASKVIEGFKLDLAVIFF